MIKVLLIGKMNDMLKNLNAALVKHFHVQLSSENASVAVSMVDVVEPNIIVISLVGAIDIDNALFSDLRDLHGHIPVLTIGTAGEQNHFKAFYGQGQFINLTRPLDNNDVINAICRRLGVSLTDVDNDAEVESPEGEDSAAVARKHILVVDDNAGTLRSIKGMLDSKYDIAIAPSGVKAMTMIGKKKPDLILLDYEMPIADGKQTLEMIRADADIKDIPVIFLTGVSDREHIQAVLGLRPAGYMLKPPVPDKLIEAIEKVFNK